LEAVYSNQAKEKGFLPFTLPHQQGKGKAPKEAWDMSPVDLRLLLRYADIRTYIL
jgi:hypothetical protein